MQQRLITLVDARQSRLLQALAALNPHQSTSLKLDKERDYPRRHLASYAELHPKEPAAVIMTEWEFDDSELATLEEMLGKASVDKRVRVQRRYGEDFTIDATIDTKKIIKHLFAKFGVTGEDAKALGGAATTAQLIEELNALPTPSEPQANLRAQPPLWPGHTAASGVASGGGHPTGWLALLFRRITPSKPVV